MKLTRFKKLTKLGVAGLLLASGFSANAVSISPTGEGEVLLFPFYTVKNNTSSSFHISNNRSFPVAVKVRFREAKNNKSVLSLNVYLAANDMWTAAVVEDGSGAKLITRDTSCTVPQVPSGGLSFSNNYYNMELDDSMERLQEGYVEAFHMGDLIDLAGFTAATNVTHSGGAPNDCASIVAAWNSGGDWDANPFNAVRSVSRANGGLSGIGYLINVDSGYQIAFDATAIEDFWLPGDIPHTAPDSIYPDLDGQIDSGTNSGRVDSDTFDSNGRPQNSTWPNTVDAVSAVLMGWALTNEYNVYSGTAAETDWVVTFPTKYFYTAVAPATAPFTNEYTNSTNGACETIPISLYNTDGRLDTVVNSANLCWATNRITFNNSELFGTGDTLINFNVPYDAGKVTMDISFWAILPTLGAWRTGLPFIGFAANVAKNGTLTDSSGNAVLANYGASFEHKKD